MAYTKLFPFHQGAKSTFSPSFGEFPVRGPGTLFRRSFPSFPACIFLAHSLSFPAVQRLLNLFSAFPTSQGNAPSLAQPGPGGEVLGLAVRTGIDLASKGFEFRVSSFGFFHFCGMKINLTCSIFASAKKL
jgi:hypothetical protein